MSEPLKPRPYRPAVGGIGERAAHFVLEAFRLADATRYPDHSICGNCDCRRRPPGWSRQPVIHPRFEECHP